MGERAQARLFPIQRHPSATAAATRANRAAARKWADARGFARYTGDFCFDDCSGFNRGHAWEGAIVPVHCARDPVRLCWDCIPYDGAPLRNFESHSDIGSAVDPPGAACVRCLASGRGGGVHRRGGMCCWECGDPSDDAYGAWLIALRSDPLLRAPWAGDKVVRP